MAMRRAAKAATLAAGAPSRPPPIPHPNDRRIDMKWQTPQAIDMRFGFEVTMYIASR